jgi:putative flavoprotein involved in K+ transport
MLDTIIIGAGQAGLCTSHFLGKRGIEHVVLERDEIGSSWKRRWDSFTLVSPNGMNALPDFPMPGPDDAFTTRDALMDYLRAFADACAAPVRTGVSVERVRALDGAGGFEIVASDGVHRARNVVIATGGFQRPRMPALAQNVASHVTQLHSDAYRNPEQLPDGAVLVVGSAQSGVQITDELRSAGRRVYLSVGGAVRLPRRYRGRDIFFWLRDAGRFERTAAELESPAERFDPNPQLSGANGGRTINLRRFGREGVQLLGRLVSADGTRLRFADDLEAKLAAADEFARDVCAKIDEAVTERALDVPEPSEDEVVPEDWTPRETPRALDLDALGIRSIIWATGFRFDFSWIEGARLDSFGYPIQRRGICQHDGLYFVGLPWLHSQKSGLLYGVGNDARHVVAHLAARHALAAGTSRPAAC